MYKLLLILFILLLGISCSQDSEQEARSEGSPEYAMEDIDYAGVIENAVFTDLDGNEVTLADFSGKVLIVDFWETWCGPCLQVFPSLQELREEFPDDFDVLAVTLGMVEGPEEARAFREDHDYDFNYLYDEHDISGQLGIHSIPFKLYIDPEGSLIRHELGSRGRDGDYESAKSVIIEHMN